MSHNISAKSGVSKHKQQAIRVAEEYENLHGNGALRRLLLANLFHTLNAGYPTPRNTEGLREKENFLKHQLRNAGATPEEIAVLVE